MRLVLQTALLMLLLAATLFVPAGTLAWTDAWVFLAAFLAFVVAAFLLLDPDLLRERSAPGSGVRVWDVAVASAGFVFLYPLPLVVAALDVHRFAWSPPLPVWLRALGLVVFVLGYAFALWAMRCNRFFATFVRIQHDRGHVAVSSGPYAWVRHPGYAGAIFGHLGVPIALGSILAWLPAACGAALFVLRTWLEDRMLTRELAGYADYARRVRWRLLPGIW